MPLLSQVSDPAQVLVDNLVALNPHEAPPGVPPHPPNDRIASRYPGVAHHWRGHPAAPVGRGWVSLTGA
ncbi:hypothetical protein STRIP9103_04236, partial [Streptomyces ipomoeae 91-03]